MRKIALMLALVLASSMAVPYMAQAAEQTYKKKTVAKKAAAKKQSASSKTGKSKIVSHLRKGKAKNKSQLARTYGVKAQRASYASSLDANGEVRLESAAALVFDESAHEQVLAKNANAQVPIASITKLMTAMVVLDSRPNMLDYLLISEQDVDTLRNSSSRLAVGTELTRFEMLKLALMSSENRAASTLARHYPGGLPAFVAAMNRKAEALGMHNTHFVDSTGLNSANVSTAQDLVKMVRAAYRYELIREFSTSTGYDVYASGRNLAYNNTNALVKSDDWDIGLSKTGFIREAGRCLVMQAKIASRPMIIVLLDSVGKYSRIGDAQRIKYWLEHDPNGRLALTTPNRQGV